VSDSIALLCAGAAKGLVLALEPAFKAATGAGVDATFGAVGALREKLLAAAPCDVVVLTAALIGALEKEGRVVPGSATSLGRVRTGIAVRAGAPLPDIRSAASLRATLAGASRLLFPDPQRATAGIHFVDVLRRLGIHDDVASRCATFPNGATAMAALAQAREPGQVGCTQITEINYTEGVALAGPLPQGFELATVYTAAVCTRARNRDLAQRLVAMLGGAESRDLRARGGFEA
jgi:molybdate transport system substrate-binding protein